MEERLIQYAKFASVGIIIAATLLFFGAVAFVQAAQTEQELSELQSEISARKSQIDRINQRMDGYREQINTLSQKTAGLLNDIEFIENQIALAELDIELTHVQIEQEELELRVLEEKIRHATTDLETQRGMLEEILFTLNKNSRVGFIEVLFSAKNFDELFGQIDQLERLNGNLQRTLEGTKATRTALDQSKSEQEMRVDQLVDLKSELEDQVNDLERRSVAKDMLIAETRASEAQYRVLLSELRAEQQSITGQISALQAEVQKRLQSGEIDRPATSRSLPANFVHPLPGARRTATFNDPSYPFRNLFEHSGIDLAMPTGTPIRAAGDGIVAWVRTGQSYGNYVMVIHEGGYATLYAHMSAFAAAADQYVEAGQVIGYVGSTGFSTGPHLHFELRYNGIPVDPSLYIPAL